MDGQVEGSTSLKEWAMTYMEYVPKLPINKTDRNGNHDFSSKLLSGRLGVYWQHLIRHARSRSQIQHIRDNLKVQEFQDAKNKKNAQHPSSMTLSETVSSDNTLRSNASLYSKKDVSVLTFGPNTSTISERSLLIKEYDETKRLLRKSIGLTQRTTMDVECRVEECEDLKHQLQVYQANIDENYEKLKFLTLLTHKTKEAIGLMKQDVKYLGHILQRTFNVTENNLNNVFKDSEHEHIRNTIIQICEKSKYMLNEITRFSNSAQKTINCEGKTLDEIKELVKCLLFPESPLINHYINDNCTVAIMVHEAVFFQIRFIIRQVENELFAKNNENVTSPPDQLKNILEEWRKQHVTFLAGAKTMEEELKEIEGETQRQAKNAKNAISELVDSNSAYNHDSSKEMKELLLSYFLVCEKRARMKMFLHEVSAQVLNRKSPSNPKSNALVKVSEGYNVEIENKKRQIDLLLQRNNNLNAKLTWLENKVRNILDTSITHSIHRILPIINPDKSNRKICAKDRICRRFNNFMVFPIYLNLSLNVCSQVCGRDVRPLLKNTRNLPFSDKYNLNGSIVIADIIRIKAQMKQVFKFLEGASLMQEKESSFDNNGNSGVEEKVKKSKDQSQLISKLNVVIEQVQKAQKHFGF